ncbi:hypothetical protein [Pseudomonas chlororaphis]|uniref:hypothetical protein n=1 Tax=Pseudomonas chlororaphis TaxID=587753 RepID=UPI0039E0B66E
MTIDKEKLKSLLWSVVASWKAEDGDLQRHTAALDELLGDKTMEEVALLLIKENDRLEVERDSSKTLLKDAIAREDRLKAENEALRKDAERYRFVRNPIGTSSPLAIWNEGKMPLFSGIADAVVDEFMAKEASHD